MLHVKHRSTSNNIAYPRVNRRAWGERRLPARVRAREAGGAGAWEGRRMPGPWAKVKGRVSVHAGRAGGVRGRDCGGGPGAVTIWVRRAGWLIGSRRPG